MCSLFENDVCALNGPIVLMVFLISIPKQNMSVFKLLANSKLFLRGSKSSTHIAHNATWLPSQRYKCAMRIAANVACVGILTSFTFFIFKLVVSVVVLVVLVVFFKVLVLYRNQPHFYSVLNSVSDELDSGFFFKTSRDHGCNDTFLSFFFFFTVIQCKTPTLNATNNIYHMCFYSWSGEEHYSGGDRLQHNSGLIHLLSYCHCSLYAFTL